MSYIQARTLTACVDGVAPSMGGLAPQYKLVKFHMGHAPLLLDEPNKTVQALPLDTDIPAMQGVFYSKTLAPSDFQYSNGKLLVRCICPADVLAEPQVYSVLYIEDSNGKLSHGVVKLPDTILPETGAETWVYVEFPINTNVTPPV